MKTFVIGAVVGVTGRVLGAIDAARVVRRDVRWRSVVIGWAVLLAALAVLNVFVEEPLKAYYRARYAQAFTISSRSMMPSLLVGDYVMTDKAAYRSQPPRRGDIVVFRYPVDERRVFVMRVIALPGEQVAVSGDGVLVNGALVPEAYLRRAPTAPGGACRYRYGCQPTTVPPDAYFLLGDDRENSQDSRYFGFVRRDKILGRVTTVYWSWDSNARWLRFDRLGRHL